MKNKWGKSFIQLVILVIYFMGAIAFKSFINDKGLVFLDFFLYTSLGFVIGIINSVGKKRNRKANTSKVILLLIPSLFLASSMFIYYSAGIIPFFKTFDTFITKATMGGKIVSMYQVLFGYLLVYSFEN